MGPLDPRLVRRAGAVRVMLAVDAALGLVAALLVLAQAVLLARVAARGFAGASARELLAPLVLLAVVAAFRGAAAWGFEVAGRRAAASALSDLRLDVVERRLHDRPAALDGAESAEVATLAVGGVDALETAFARYLPQLVLALVVPVAVLVLVASIDLLSAGIMLLTLPLVPVFMWLVGRYTERRTAQRREALRLLATHFLDVVRGLPTLRAFNRGRAQAERIEQVSDEYRRATMGTLRVAFLSGTVLELAATLGIALVAVTVGVRLAEGGLGFEAGLTVLVLAPELYLPLRNLAAQYHASADGLAVGERLLDLAEEEGGRPRGGAAPPSPRDAAGPARGRLLRVPRTTRAGARRSRPRARAGRDRRAHGPERGWEEHGRRTAPAPGRPHRRARDRRRRRPFRLRLGRLAGPRSVGASAADPLPRDGRRQHPPGRPRCRRRSRSPRCRARGRRRLRA